MGDLPGITQRAQALLHDIAAGGWSQARAMFDDRMLGAIDSDGLDTVWTRLIVESGRYQGQGDPVVTNSASYTSVTVPLQFRDATLYGQVTFDAQGKVAGLHFLFRDPNTGKGRSLPVHLILRCSDGHLYTGTRMSLFFRAMHFGNVMYRPCPVDGQWRTASFVDPNTLTKAELEEAASRPT